MADRRRQPKVRSDEETDRLVVALKAKGWTQKRIGAYVGLSQSAVCELLQRRRGVGRSAERYLEETPGIRLVDEVW